MFSQIMAPYNCILFLSEEGCINDQITRLGKEILLTKDEIIRVERELDLINHILDQILNGSAPEYAYVNSLVKAMYCDGTFDDGNLPHVSSTSLQLSTCRVGIDSQALEYHDWFFDKDMVEDFRPIFSRKMDYIELGLNYEIDNNSMLLKFL